MAKKDRLPLSENISVVMLGSMNPAIFHPEWFVRHNMMSESTENEVKVVSHEATEIRIGNVEIISFPDRLVLRASNIAYSEAVFDLAIGILLKLPHTPLTACGINHQAVYKADSVAHWHHVGDTLAPKDIWENLGKQPGLNRLEIKLDVDDEPFKGYRLLRIQPIPSNHPSHPAIRFEGNRHFDLDPREDSVDDPQPAEVASKFLKEFWEEATRSARTTAEMVFDKIPKI